jgi:Cu2+-exporting ATPase
MQKHHRHDRRDHHGHHDHHLMMEENFRKRFFVSLIFIIPVLVLSPTIQNWLGFFIPKFWGYHYILFSLASIIALWGAWPFYQGAKDELRRKTFGMMTLVSLAVVTGYLYSVGATFFFEATDFYWEISTLVLFLLFGHWMEMKAIRKSSSALNELVKLIPPRANLVKDGEIIEVKTEELKVGDIVLVRPGEKIPIDGVVIDGMSNVNEALITGESKPVTKTKDNQVIGGTINIDGSLKIKVTKTGEDTALSQIVNLVKTAQESKPRSQKLADRAAHYLTLIAIFVGLLTFVYWSALAGQGVLFALTLTITVVVITCPHALGLAIPTVTIISTTLAAKNGILVKDMQGVELACRLDYVIFDKTGTLTKGEFGVSDIIQLADWDKKEILARAASLDIHSDHFISRAIVNQAKKENLPFKKVANFQSIAGQGVKGEIDGQGIYLGNKTLMKALGVNIQSVLSRVGKLSSEGKTVVYLATKDGIKGLIALSDIIKEESKEAVRKLKNLGIKVAMLTGDNRQVAGYVAKELGLDTFFAEVLPGNKSDKVKELQKGGKIVAMVGDGVNDAPALIQADIGIAVGAGTDVAIESAEIVLVRNNPLDIVKLIKLSQKTMIKMKQNLAWATGYNIVAIPVAAGILYKWGIILRPEWGALIMAASSIIVVANALLLKKERL